jgi:hypothetical protein
VLCSCPHRKACPRLRTGHAYVRSRTHAGTARRASSRARRDGGPYITPALEWANRPLLTTAGRHARPHVAAPGSAKLRTATCRHPMDCPRPCHVGSARVVSMHVDGVSFLGLLLTTWRRVASQSACQCMLTGPSAFLAEKVKSLACAWQDGIVVRFVHGRDFDQAHGATLCMACI